MKTNKMVNFGNGKKVLNFLIAAGGTGGHLFPAMAVGEKLKQLSDVEINLYFIGTENRMESRIVPEQGYEYFPMPIYGFAGLSLKSLKLPLNILKSIKIAKRVIKDKKIDGVIVAGAYLSYPPGVAAYKSGIPLFLMESNVNLGKSNKALSKKATKIFTSYKETEGYIDKSLHSRVFQYGNPMRDFILDLPETDKAKEFFKLDFNKNTVLIIGGSLGARSINQVIEKNLEGLGGSSWQFIWQTGRNYQPPSEIPNNIVCTQFIDDMSSAYSVADIIVSRSGATATAEICLVGKPSILIPLSSASNNEQYYNGKVIAENGGAILIEDGDLESRLMEELEQLMGDEKMRSELSVNAKKLGKPNAARDVAREILKTYSENIR